MKRIPRTTLEKALSIAPEKPLVFEGQRVDIDAMLAPEAIKQRRSALHKSLSPEAWCEYRASMAVELWTAHREALHLWDALASFALYAVDPANSRSGRQLIQLLLRFAVELTGASHRRPFGAGDVAIALGFRVGRGRDIRGRAQSEQLDQVLPLAVRVAELVSAIAGEAPSQAELYERVAMKQGVTLARVKEAIVRERNPERKKVQSGRPKTTKVVAAARRAAGAALHDWPPRKAKKIK